MKKYFFILLFAVVLFLLIPSRNEYFNTLVIAGMSMLWFLIALHLEDEAEREKK